MQKGAALLFDVGKRWMILVFDVSTSQVGGYMVAGFRLGGGEAVVKDFSVRVDDGKYHVLYCTVLY